MRQPRASLVLPDVTLAPGGFFQYSGVLETAGFSNGYVRVERISGSAPYYAYGVINDQANSDGSFVFPVVETSLAGRTGQSLPVIVETPVFSSELTLTNFSSSAKTLNFSFVADAVGTSNNTATFQITLQAGEQKIIAEYCECASAASRGGDWRRRSHFCWGTVRHREQRGHERNCDWSENVGAGRRWTVWPLLQRRALWCGFHIQCVALRPATDHETRSNLALVNTGETDASTDVFSIDIYNGLRGSRWSPLKGSPWEPGDGFRSTAVLALHAPGVSQGYAQVKRTSGNNPFIAYAVINDGGQPGERSGDGAFVLSS